MGTGIGSGVSAVGSHLDRINENLSRSLNLGGGARAPERSQPSLSDVFESARTGSLPVPLQQEDCDDDLAYSDAAARRAYRGLGSESCTPWADGFTEDHLSNVVWLVGYQCCHFNARMWAAETAEFTI